MLSKGATFKAWLARIKRLRNSSPKEELGIMTRRAQVQRCPAVIKEESRVLYTAASISSNSSITKGLFPPISKAKITSGRPLNCW